MSTKRCSRCKKAKDRAEFGLDNRTKDQLQRYCKDCKAEVQKLRSKGRITPRKLTKQMQLTGIAEKMTKGKSPTEAYAMTVAKDPNSKYVTKSAGNFFRALQSDQIDFLRRKLGLDKRIKQINNYFDSVLDETSMSTHSEQKDAIMVLMKLTDLFAPEHISTKNETPPEQERQATMEAVVKILEDKDEENNDG